MACRQVCRIDRLRRVVVRGGGKRSDGVRGRESSADAHLKYLLVVLARRRLVRDRQQLRRTDKHDTEEMMQPCLADPHAISLVAHRNAEPLSRERVQLVDRVWNSAHTAVQRV